MNPAPDVLAEPTRANSVILLSLTLLVVMLGYGMVMPVLPFLIQKVGAGGSDLGLLTSVYALMQLVCAPVWGVVSDRIGRKPVLMVGVIGYAAALTVFGMSERLWMLYLARVFSGVLSSATMPTAMAYIADRTQAEQRSKAMGRLGAAMGMGVILGPLLGGLLSGRSLALPFFVGAGMAVLAAGLILLILPSDQPGMEQRAIKPPSRPDLAALKSFILGPAGSILLLIFIAALGLSNFQGITGLYLIDRFHLPASQIGVLWTIIGVVMVVSQGGLVGPLSERLGDAGLVRLGLVCGALGLGGFALAGNYLLLLVAAAFFILSVALIGPPLNALIARYGGSRQGTMMGVNSAAGSLGRVFGPLWAGWLYDVNIVYPFISGVVALLLGLLVAVVGVHEAQRSAPCTSNQT